MTATNFRYTRRQIIILPLTITAAATANNIFNLVCGPPLLRPIFHARRSCIAFAVLFNLAFSITATAGPNASQPSPRTYCYYISYETFAFQSEYYYFRFALTTCWYCVRWNCLEAQNDFCDLFECHIRTHTYNQHHYVYLCRLNDNVQFENTETQ